MCRKTYRRLVAATLFILASLSFPQAPSAKVEGRIAFADGGSIWTIRADGSDRRRLTPPGNATSPVWSRDGRKLAFVRASSAGQKIGSIHMMNADGTGHRKLAAGKCWSPLWSPAADELVYVRGYLEDEAPGTYLAFVDSRGRPTRKPLLHLATTHLHSTTTHQVCSWDGTGSRLSVTLHGFLFSDVEEVTIGEAGLQRWPLYEHNRVRGSEDWFVYHGWAPDGSGRDLLVRHRLIRGQAEDISQWTTRTETELTVGKAGEGERRTVARLVLRKGQTLPLHASWSPDGSQIVYESDGKIYVTSVHHPNPRLLTTGACPRWSPQ